MVIWRALSLRVAGPDSRASRLSGGGSGAGGSAFGAFFLSVALYGRAAVVDSHAGGGDGLEHSLCHRVHDLVLLAISSDTP